MRCDISARMFRTNRGMLKQLKFCRGRNRHKGRNQHGTIQTTNNNHDNVNNNEVGEIDDSTSSCQNNQNKNKENFYLNDAASTKFLNELNKAWEKIVFWK